MTAQDWWTDVPAHSLGPHDGLPAAQRAAHAPASPPVPAAQGVLQDLKLRPALRSDVTCLAVLAMQVFLHTYATRGIDADLADEALQQFSPAALAARLDDPQVRITVAELLGRLLAYVDVQAGITCALPQGGSVQVLRMYVQALFKRMGLGSSLMTVAEASARRLGARALWLTAWVGNTPARAF